MLQENRSFDLVVVGGGVIGLSVARCAALAGLRTIVVEKDTPGNEASRAAAGMLSPVGEQMEPEPFLNLGLHSLSLYPEFAAELQAETSLTVGYRPNGKLEVAFDGHEMESLRAHLRSHGDRVSLADPLRLLSGEEVRELEPALSPGVLGGLLLPGDHSVDNRALTRALLRSCELAGVALLTHAPVRRLVQTSGRVRGVALEDGSEIHGPAVVLAAGAWSSRLEGLPRPLSVRPVRGQMLSVDAVPPPCHRVIATPRAYLVPRDDHLIVGATSEEVGFDRRPTPEGVLTLLNGLLEAFPHLQSAPIRETWTGFRPATPDDLPILGPDPLLSGLVYATGHYRNGILLAPATARLICDQILGAGPDGPILDALRPFAPDRPALLREP